MIDSFTKWCEAVYIPVNISIFRLTVLQRIIRKSSSRCFHFTWFPYFLKYSSTLLFTYYSYHDLLWTSLFFVFSLWGHILKYVSMLCYLSMVVILVSKAIHMMKQHINLMYKLPQYPLSLTFCAFNFFIRFYFLLFKCTKLNRNGQFCLIVLTYKSDSVNLISLLRSKIKNSIKFYDNVDLWVGQNVNSFI